VAVDPTTHKVLRGDCDNNRVLRFPSIYALTNGVNAEAVLGQSNFTSSELPLPKISWIVLRVCLWMRAGGCGGRLGK